MDRVSVLGIRHHGPGSARSVRAELDRVKPAVVLIEGPADADPLVELAGQDGMEPPVALLAYAPESPQTSVFWPFAVFSPEWQAIRWAVEHDVPVRFCDLPAGMVLVDDSPVPISPEEAAESVEDVVVEDVETEPEAVRGDPIARLAEAAGYDDPERWWDDVVESRLDGASPFPALAEAMAALREDTPPGDEPHRVREERREAYMRQTLRTALKEFDGPVAVVCGAWHAPALTEPLPPAAADAAVLRGVAKRKATLTWVPWTHSRLAFGSGYGAGIESPGWYHHLFTAPDKVVTRWLTKVSLALRERDLPVSSAHVIEAVRLAETLAVLRGRPLAGLAEVMEATRAVLCEGDDVPLAFVTSDLVVGEKLGGVPEGAPAVPLDADLRARARTLRLKIDPLEKKVALDLRKDTDRARSVLLHQLASLGIRWGTPASDDVRSSGTFRESWDLRWRPELAVDVIDAALWGTTVAGAATAKLADQAKKADDLATVTAIVEQVLLADLPGALPPVLTALDAKAALDLDVEHLMAAVPPLVRAQRYGDVRDTDTSALGAVVEALVIRVCAGLPSAVNGLADEAAALLRRRVDELHAALALHVADEGGEQVRDRWLAALRQLADRRDVHGLLVGRVVRLLIDADVLDADEASFRLAAQLSVGVPTQQQAAWVEGLLSGGGLLLVHDRDLLAVVDGWVATLPAEAFMDVLPLVRRTFGAFSSPERSNIGDVVKRLSSGGPATVESGGEEDVDPARAAGVLRTVAAILAGAK